MMILSIFIWLLVGFMTAKLAQQKGRDPYMWFAIGVLLGIFALLILILLPPVKPEEQETNKAPLPVQIAPAEPPIQNEILIKEWHCITTTGLQQGPLKCDALKKLWSDGQLNSKSFVWTDKMVAWQRVEELPDLLSALQ